MLPTINEIIDQKFSNKREYPDLEGERIINRELSWMEFNQRVLEEAQDSTNPLYERLNFLAITCSNLDEHFMVRVASLYNLIEAGSEKKDPANLTPSEQLEALMARCHEFYKDQYVTFNKQIMPALQAEDIYYLTIDQITDAEYDYLAKYYDDNIYPVLTPLAVDAGRPFPLIPNQNLNLFVTFETQEEKADALESTFFAIVEVPSILPRLIKLPGEEKRFVLIEAVIAEFLNQLFYNQEIESTACFRVMRNADYELDDEEISDLMIEMEGILWQRERGSIIRLEIQREAGKKILNTLQSLMDVSDQAVFRIRGPIDLKFVDEIRDLYPDSNLRYKKFNGQITPAFGSERDPDTFEIIRDNDLILHHPFESFDPTIKVIQQAAQDPDVLAIKQTLYRVSGNSPIVKALAEAAENGKHVMVLLELKARFDEESNIHWARRLERAGCHVIYGLKGLKTHSKITLIVRREESGIKRYVHLGTGNYNDITARIYTDFGLWTASEQIGQDATDFFNMISGYSIPMGWRKIIPAPRWLRKETLARIKQEKKHAEAGRQAIIVAKINSLIDSEIIEELYSASQAGVKICLIVRGICGLKAGVKGLSENIEVRSLVGRFLEHSRIFYYYNDGREDIFLSSADWMPRNLDRRVEILFPIEDEGCRERVLEVLIYQMLDTDRARIMQGDGSYIRFRDQTPVEERVDSQIALMQSALRAAEEVRQRPINFNRYEPLSAPENF
ncbi:MAG TPA: polyphosphate kinase 1 [Clostridiaceae bacterium]|nr:polyphosphate kinase 1 [Clostridiaceae bacterium]